MTREPIFNYWRLLALVLFFAVMIPLGLGWRWVVENVLSERAVFFGAGIPAGMAIQMLLNRHDKRQRDTAP